MIVLRSKLMLLLLMTLALLVMVRSAPLTRVMHDWLLLKSGSGVVELTCAQFVIGCKEVDVTRIEAVTLFPTSRPGFPSRHVTLRVPAS